MTIPILLSNNAGTVLALPLASGDTSATLYSGTGAIFPSPGAGQYFPLTLISASNPTTIEIVYCTARSGDVVTITRAQENTTALSWNAGDLVNNQITAGIIEAIERLFVVAPPFQVQYLITSSVSPGTVPAGYTRVRVQLVGGGGGGAGTDGTQAGGGGGAGGWADAMISGLTPGATIPFVVGAGGAGGASGQSGSSGGNTSFGSSGFLQATGGSGGVFNSAPAGGAGGAGGGSAAFDAEYGGYGTDGSPQANIMGGSGGASFYGGGGRGASGGGAPANGQAAGSGGGGSYDTASGGGAGAPGKILIEWQP